MRDLCEYGPVSVTDSWRDGKRETGKSGLPRSASRSLKDALSEAGLGEAQPRVTLREALRRKDVSGAGARSSLRTVEDEPPVKARRVPAPVQDDDAPSPVPAHHPLAVVEEVPPLLSQASRTAEAAHGVVSPPPWLRAARRGRWHARALNAAGWFVTIMVVGSIITVAGRYLAVPAGMESIYTARQ